MVAAAVALAASCFVGDAVARRRPPRRPALAPAPASSAHTKSGVVSLRTPSSDMILVRGGRFFMGSSLGEYEHARMLCLADPGACGDPVIDFADEGAKHAVRLSDYWLDRTEVTVAAYRRCVEVGACRAPPYEKGAKRFDKPTLPVVLVTWDEARTYCAWAGKRLPTEAEWERAARGLVGRRYAWGVVYNPFLSNHGRGSSLSLDASDGFLELSPVGSFRDGHTPDGFADLTGNVEEWVADYYAPELSAIDEIDPVGPAQGERRVVRGGSFTHARPYLRAANRDGDFPYLRKSWRGFRCARDAGARLQAKGPEGGAVLRVVR
jgi:sulfatase modifying factor 1